MMAGGIFPMKLAGVPPGKLHVHEVGGPVDASVNTTPEPVHVVVVAAIKPAFSPSSKGET